MLHYQCCLTCLPHTRLSCFAFFFSEVRFLKFFFKLLLMWEDSGWLLLIIIIADFVQCAYLAQLLIIRIIVFQTYIYDTMIPTQEFQLYYCRKIVRFVWKPVYQTEKLNSSSWHELNCFLCSFLSVTVEQKLCFSSTTGRCCSVL